MGNEIVCLGAGGFGVSWLVRHVVIGRVLTNTLNKAKKEKRIPTDQEFTELGNIQNRLDYVIPIALGFLGFATGTFSFINNNPELAYTAFVFSLSHIIEAAIYLGIVRTPS